MMILFSKYAKHKKKNCKRSIVLDQKVYIHTETYIPERASQRFLIEFMEKNLTKKKSSFKPEKML